MTPAKKRRLESAGFKLGSADEFLSPSSAESAAGTPARDISKKTIARRSVEGDKAKPLIENRSGPSFTSRELAARLKVTIQTVRNMKGRKELVAYTGFGANNPLRFPSWQFIAAGSRLQTRPWVKPLIEAYGSNGWGLLDFMTVPRTPLNGLSYLASTERGEDAIREVIDAAGRSNPD